MDVTEVDSFQHLPQNTTHRVLIESCRTLIEIIKHRVVHELKDQVEMFLATENFDQIHQVLIA